jgi:uncharacterized protein
MKKHYLIMAAAALIAVTVHIYIGFAGYHKITVEDGTLYGRAMGNDKELVVLLIAGSGPTDMDGNSEILPGRNDSLLLIARELAKEGISTFRYDKRAAGKSAETFDLENITEIEALIGDCVAVIEYLKDQGYKKIVLAGHSKGSLIGMLAAIESPVDGFISLAGTGNRIDITLEKQLLAQLPEDSSEIQILRNLRNGELTLPVSGDDGELNFFTLNNQKFILSWMQYDPAEILAGMKIPVLIIGGEADIQVDREDFEALAKVREPHESIFIEDMNHILKEVITQKEQEDSYYDPSFPLHSELIPHIVEFIAAIR